MATVVEDTPVTDLGDGLQQILSVPARVAVGRGLQMCPAEAVPRFCRLRLLQMLSEDGTPEDQRLTPLEQFAAMVTALLHDVDHMGLNNSYHVKADTPYGILYTASGIPSGS